MVVTWLDRSLRSGDPGTGRGCASGQALTRAVTAWADEMLCEEDDATRMHLLGGYLGTADIVDHLTEHRGIPLEAIHAPGAVRAHDRRLMPAFVARLPSRPRSYRVEARADDRALTGRAGRGRGT